MTHTINASLKRFRFLFFFFILPLIIMIIGINPIYAHVQPSLLASDLTGNPTSGSMFFVSLRDGTQDLYRYDFETSTVKRITTNGGTTSFPTISPDGKRLCFESVRTGNSEIFCTDRDGNNPVNLTNDPGEDGMPRFSPDGTLIAYHRRVVGQTHFQIWVMNADGTNKRQLTFENGYMGEPSWFPNGTKIVFDGDKPDRNILTINLDGTGLKVINSQPGEQRRPSVSPDGMYIYYDSIQNGAFQIYRMLFDGSNQTALTSTGENLLPQVSPDGTKVAFMSNRDAGDMEIYISNADGTEPTRITKSLGIDSVPSWANSVPVCTPEVLTVPFVKGPNGVTTQQMYGVVDQGGGIGIASEIPLPPSTGNLEEPPSGDMGTPNIAAPAADLTATTTVNITVSGTGQAAGAQRSDAFYSIRSRWG